ncbi:acyltransferase family protein [Deminuibacter soli]|uniref:Acyltransferase n=1 Tax=Deminuibacter soli TaxID=2291815 RepID=A0A3E1NRH6_9BACT|nr:acyltransferase [Deminuibacter soli]RFM30525.1 acyltransferase [Deminuibacter soli]
MRNIPPLVQPSRQHFDMLDGLRGIAAIAVVIFHFMEWVYTDPGKNFIGHGFLAVDFFFCLSGFVIGYAYDNRIAKMGLRNFFAARLIRLHPLVILGSVLGLLGFFLDPFTNNAGLYSAGQLVLIFLCSILMSPYPVMKDRAFNLFGLNAPAWSLFWEYVANVVYAFVLCRLKRAYLVVLAVLSAIAVCLVVRRAGTIVGGWNGHTFWDGGARVSYSFIAGLLVYRFNWIIKNKLGFAGLTVLLLLAVLMPFSKWNWLTELFVVLLYFPLLIALGAGATLTPRFHKICVFSGNISYPLYMTHYMVLWAWGNYYGKYKPNTTQLFFIVSASIVVLIGFAYLVMRVYDMPVRKYLTAKWKKANV